MKNFKACMMCRMRVPPSHVIVYDDEGIPRGEVCGTHTLREIVMDRRDRFQLAVLLVPERLREPAAIER